MIAAKPPLQLAAFRKREAARLGFDPGQHLDLSQSAARF
jgi:hypothetical protein